MKMPLFGNIQISEGKKRDGGLEPLAAFIWMRAPPRDFHRGSQAQIGQRVNQAQQRVLILGSGRQGKKCVDWWANEREVVLFNQFRKQPSSPKGCPIALQLGPSRTQLHYELCCKSPSGPKGRESGPPSSPTTSSGWTRKALTEHTAKRKNSCIYSAFRVTLDIKRLV